MFSGLFRASVIALSFGQVLAGVELAGVNIPGFDFGCVISGFCFSESVTPPLPYRKERKVTWNIPRDDYFQNGPEQMNHFTDLGFNIYRLGVGWQFLVNNKLGGKLDRDNFALYDELVQACLKTGAYCIIDVHNYARWNDKIIGQSKEVTNAHFTSLWSQLATKYVEEPKIVMGLMNEPHDLDMNLWANTVQAAVTAIRNANATTQKILLPGTRYTKAEAFVKESAEFLSRVTNPDKSTDNLIYEVHQYFDNGNKTEATCNGDLIDKFDQLIEYLSKNKRRAVIGEIGGGGYKNECIPLVIKGLQYLNNNADVIEGIIGWGAGAFSPTRYPLSLTPEKSAETGFKDKPFITQGLLPTFKGIPSTTD